MIGLYIIDSYIKSFEARVQTVKDGRFAVLDKTAFYPNSGGQPSDTGVIHRDGEIFPVVYVGLFDGEISHELAREGIVAGEDRKSVG